MIKINKIIYSLFLSLLLLFFLFFFFLFFFSFLSTLTSEHVRERKKFLPFPPTQLHVQADGRKILVAPLLLFHFCTFFLSFLSSPSISISLRHITSLHVSALLLLATYTLISLAQFFVPLSLILEHMRISLQFVCNFLSFRKEVGEKSEEKV